MKKAVIYTRVSSKLGLDRESQHEELLARLGGEYEISGSSVAFLLPVNDERLIATHDNPTPWLQKLLYRRTEYAEELFQSPQATLWLLHQRARWHRASCF